MLSGFSGHLVAEQYLELHLDSPSYQSVGPVAAHSLRAWRAGQQMLGPASSLRTVIECGLLRLLRTLGYTECREHARASDVALLSAGGSGEVPVAVVATLWGQPLGQLWSPAIALALTYRAPWCLLFNGTHLRVLSAQRTTSRRFVEFDLDAVGDDERTAAALWAVAHRNALTEGPGSLSTLVEGSDRHAAEVCASLRQGVLEAAEEMLRTLWAGGRKDRADAAFEQALTIVYRVLFLLFAEARSLLPVWHPVYRESYGIEPLCDAAAETPAPGLWDALRAISRLSHAGCRAGDLRVTAFNGRLFAPARTPLAERHDLDNEAARRSLVALATRPAVDREARVRVSYRELGVEQLGAVYETLLDYAPVVHRQQSEGGRVRSRVALQPGSGVRKRTGSFYTPQSMTRYLVDRTLAPLVREASLEQILSLRVLDPAMGSGAFLVGACDYLAEACEAAMLRDDRCHPTDIGPNERASLRRQVAERCLFGVDLNPMAVQLARLSIWLTTLAADLPLSFLDHRLRVGDSLAGAWLHNLQTPPGGRRRRNTPLPLFPDQQLATALRDTLPARFTLAHASQTLADVRLKERTLAELERSGSPLSRWKRLADLWCSRWFDPDLGHLDTTFGALSDAILDAGGPLPEKTAREVLNRAAQVAGTQSFFHWELEFPEVYFDASGQRRAAAGFDAILGNPPWDMVRNDGPDDVPRRASSLVRFSRDAGVYRAQSDGHANRYQLFLERSLALLRPGGRLGLVLPSGLLVDQGSAALRRQLFSASAVESIVGFDNRRAIFPIHRSIRFVLLTAETGRATTEFECRLGQSDPSVLDSGGPSPTPSGSETPRMVLPTKPMRLSVDLLRLISGDDLTVPELRSAMDLAIVEGVARRFAPLGAFQGWSARFGRELNATEDRELLVAGSGHGRLPVIEGKLLEPFRVHQDKALRFIHERDAADRLGRRHQRARLAYRDVASPTNRTTLIAAILPRGCVSTHTLFCLKTPLPAHSQWFLCGLFNSVVVNYLVRLQVSTHVTTTIVERLPIPRLDQAAAAGREIAALAWRLARRPADDCWPRLHARVARVYDLTDDEFAHVLDSFPLIDVAERQAALATFRRL